MSDLAPTSYSELADILDVLPLLVRETCRARRLNQKAAAKQMGVSESTVSRLLNGVGGLALESAATIIRWLDQPPVAAKPGLVYPAGHIVVEHGEPAPGEPWPDCHHGRPQNNCPECTGLQPPAPTDTEEGP